MCKYITNMCNNQYVFSQTSHSFQSVINAMVNKIYVNLIMLALILILILY